MPAETFDRPKTDFLTFPALGNGGNGALGRRPLTIGSSASVFKLLDADANTLLPIPCTTLLR